VTTLRETDLRMPLLGLAAWAGSLLAAWPAGRTVGVSLLGVGLAAVALTAVRPGRVAWTCLGMVVVAAAVAGVAAAHACGFAGSVV